MPSHRRTPAARSRSITERENQTIKSGEHTHKSVLVRRTDQQALPRNFEQHGLPRLHMPRLSNQLGNDLADAVAEISENGFHAEAT